MFDLPKTAETAKEAGSLSAEKLNPKFMETGEKQEKGNLNPKFMDNIQDPERENGKIYIKTINEGNEGKENENGVRYERRTILINGVEAEGVFPVFDSKYDAQLPEEMLNSKDSQQNKYCNEQLNLEIENNPEFAGQFTPEQLKQINDNETPDGYTWHHNEESGKMQLVRTDDHEANRHTGGRAIWGGGHENR